jgi:glycosyltransferase involved in cell wall biosynthesis
VSVTVAIPVRNGGRLLIKVLQAIESQTVAHELLICDSNSTDGSPDIARAYGARVIQIAASEFNHGGTRNLLMREAKSSHVALLTQDAEPADDHWLERMLSGFELSGDVAIVYGPYEPREDASLAVRIELQEWFSSLASDGRPRLDRLAVKERDIDAIELAGARGFFTDANACISRVAWERVPFRNVSYAEDRALAIDMMRAGYAKAFVPSAAVLHSHHYSATELLRRCFDEWRGLREIYGMQEPADPRHLLRQLRGHLGQARRVMLSEGTPPLAQCGNLLAIAAHHTLRLSGAVLGSRAERMPPRLRAALSLERRASFERFEPDGRQSITREGGPG